MKPGTCTLPVPLHFVGGGGYLAFPERGMVLLLGGPLGAQGAPAGSSATRYPRATEPGGVCAALDAGPCLAPAAVLCAGPGPERRIGHCMTHRRLPRVRGSELDLFAKLVYFPGMHT